MVSNTFLNFIPYQKPDIVNIKFLFIQTFVSLSPCAFVPLRRNYVS